MRKTKPEKKCWTSGRRLLMRFLQRSRLPKHWMLFSSLPIRSALNKRSRPKKSIYNGPRYGFRFEICTSNYFFLSVEQVEQGFILVFEELGDIFLRFKSDAEVSEKFDQFSCYFRKTSTKCTSRAPILETSIWNENNLASEGLVRTNDAVDGWTYGIQSPFIGSHPTVWTFIQKFCQDALLHTFKTLQAVAGQ